MTGQGSLFESFATRGSSRASDPQTSRDAGRSVADEVLRDQQALVLHVLDVFSRHDQNGATAYELWEFLTGQGNRVKENVIAKRLTELREHGWVRLTGATRPGSSHRLQQVHAITPAGHDRWVAYDFLRRAVVAGP